MTRALLMIGLGAAVALAGCGGGGTTPPQPPAGTTTKLISASTGGTVNAPTPNGDVSVTIPAGALGANTVIELTPLTSATLPIALSLGNVVLAAATFGPAGTTFSTPATITFPLPSAKPVGAQLVVFVLNPSGSGWTGLGLATVQAGGLTATITVDHFSTYALAGSSQISGTAVNGPGMGFIFASGAMLDGYPVDWYFISSGPSIKPGQSPAKVTTDDYAATYRATEGGYSLEDEIPVQAGTVLMFKGQMPGDSNYYKMKVLDIQGSALTFVYEAILKPPNILGEWDIEYEGTMTIMAAAATTGYVIHVYDLQKRLTKIMSGSFGSSSAKQLKGTWQHADLSPGGNFSMDFHIAYMDFTGSYSGTESGSWLGHKLP